MFSKAVLALDCAKTTEQIEGAIRNIVLRDLRRRGAVVGMSGGVDSSVVAALCVRALGSDRVVGLFMPERDSADDSLRLGDELARRLGIRTELVNVGPTLETMGCYNFRDEAIRRVFPEYGEGWKSKLTLPPLSDRPRFNIYSIVVQSPEGEIRQSVLPLDAYLQVVAATNMKQRTRKLTEYFHAERLNYAVAGTPNRLEYDQGFFVKYGDGASDFKPIAHLYKSQVFALAEYLEIPEEIRSRSPTTDTYSLQQTQEEFYFALDYKAMDLCLWAFNHGISVEEAASAGNLTPAQVAQAYRDIETKRRATAFLHRGPILVEEVPEIHPPNNRVDRQRE